ncbi:hypothetical protein [Halomonas sp. NO4]|uniref:hypothetical protein n=1 Tax=Halomonas sp. NO4 TaxID=2484813 RepID=UPI0013D816E1|nr:hypothetical protein [Halomonas sp. NO4]
MRNLGMGRAMVERVIAGQVSEGLWSHCPNHTRFHVVMLAQAIIDLVASFPGRREDAYAYLFTGDEPMSAQLLGVNPEFLHRLAHAYVELVAEHRPALRKAAKASPINREAA